jgi:uncharacterized protein
MSVFGLVRLLLFVFVLWLVFVAVRRLFLLPVAPRQDKGREREQKSLPLVQDPQCGRFIVERDAVRASLRGQVLHFCSQECCDLYKNK